ncbi:glutathione-dependent formaldehyde dehydrogenase [Rhodomicrobium sp. Az07]|uniref:zinc-dependent alcohol dehydrogenase n=1 Tax=Rhodomicrobium sp. Az07 TaxID=2839034 RepID=UPI001BE9BD85|nr:zinc-dependent alcohol dehydrogenase [Rhodomicrobium sp. Az07]MBT3069992.1 glutathione-dependent formaldehyde dehydrogenase [Rhodomicrobium sp. Az07]
MKALCWEGVSDIRYQTVPDPKIEHGRDAIVKVSSTAICGSDLHLFNGFIPGMEAGDVIGHEFMGEVMEVGKDNKKLKVGDRVVVPFTICCGECEQCLSSNFSVCERSNRNKGLAEKVFGHSPAGLFGYTHLTGGYPGGQAEYVRVPYADVAPIKVPSSLTDDQVLFLSDIFPTGWQAAVQCDIQPTDTVAVWGAGPVGQFCIRSAVLLGAKKIVAIDRLDDRLSMAKAGGADEIINFEKEDVFERLKDLTDGNGPEKCIDAVGLEAHATASFDSVIDRAKQALMLESDRPHVLRQMIMACRPAGVLSVPGVYGGFIDHMPMGAFMNKALTMRTGQTHVSRWSDDLLRRIEEGQIDPSFVITHKVSLEEGPEMYKTFREKSHGCVKVVMQPGGVN